MAGISPTVLVQEASELYMAKSAEIDRNYQDRVEKRREKKALQEQMQDFFGRHQKSGVLGDLSFRHLMECTMGREAARMLWEDINSGHLGNSVLMENAGGAIDTSAFSSITGQIVYSEIKERFENPMLIGRNLVEMKTTNFLDGEKIPGISMPADDFASLGELQPYPWVGISEDYIETPRPVKRGGTIGVTRELVKADRTGGLLDRVGMIGDAMALNREKRILTTVLDTGTPTYKRNGQTAVAAYSTSTTNHPFVNTHSNALQDYTDIENMMLLFDAITDPITGEPIVVGGADIIVPSALSVTANRLKNATEVRQVANSIETIGSNPLSQGGLNGHARIGNIWSSAYVKSITGSASTWFGGNFKKAFRYISVWDIEVAQVPNSAELFLRDVLFALKCGEFGVGYCHEPRYVVRNT